MRERFEAKFYVTPGCWIWTKGRYHDGYGQFAVSAHERSVRAHRVSYELYVGPIPEDLHVLHRCDVRACVNPEHLFLGTRVDNMQDMIQKGRHYSPGRGKTHCPCGLPYSGDNLYVTPTGDRQCRGCRSRRSREYKERLKARG